MNAQEIKNELNENTELIVKLLEEMGFHHIKTFDNKRVSGAFPDGDNITSLQILLGLNDNGDAFLYTSSWTRNFKGGDIFSFVKWIFNFDSNGDAISYVADIIGVKYSYERDNRESSDCARFLKGFIRKTKNIDYYDEHILDESILDKFYNVPSSSFFNDNIDVVTQKKFGVMYDYWDNRVVFPIRNEYGQLLTIKGRTLDEDFLINGTSKYLYYYNYSGERYLYGMYENLHNIIESDTIIIAEAEKSVMQANAFGINNVVAISKKHISNIQLRKILQLGIRRVVIMLDKGVLEEEIIEECKSFKGLVEVWYTIDKDDIFTEKESPMDCGYIKFKKLYDSKIKYKGE